MKSATAVQMSTCERFGSPVIPVNPALKIGIALETISRHPLNALRHPSTADTAGWYVWGGEFSDAEDFFRPLHISHLNDVAPDVVPYLALAPGWRVMLAPGAEDVWFDPQLLNV